MINTETMSTFQYKNVPPYLLLVAESSSLAQRKITKVLVSKHRGYIFIQTNQPMYNPDQKVQCRIFTLDHTMRPHEELFHLSIINAAGNTIMKSLKTAKGGIFKHVFDIPDVSKMGTWKIKAHYEGDEGNAVFREFKVQKFVLPSFEVSIAMEHSYVLLSAKEFVFTISAIYSRGDKVKGAYHCQFGVANRERTKKQIVSGLELTGSIESGSARVSISIAEISEKLKTQTLQDLQQRGAQLYLGVFVTNIKSGEMQKAEAYLPVISNKYTMDLSRTRSYFVPGYPLDVVVVMRLPDGSPAPGVPVDISVEASADRPWSGTTDNDGAASTVFNINTPPSLTVKVTADGIEQTKEIKMMSSPSKSYLYLDVTHKVYSVNELLSVTFNTKNSPASGSIHYMVLSRGILVKHGSLPLGSSIKDNWLITSDMVPSFRLIGYFHNQQGDIIADSVWIDVRDACEIKVKVEAKQPFIPGKSAVLNLDLNGEAAKVALLAVDKAFYGLQADNKLTGKQVFSTMQSYDLGCSYGGGADSTSVLRDAGLSFVAQTSADWKKSFDCGSTRQRRSVDLEQEMLTFKSRFSDETLQECCVHGFSLIPMSLSCEQRAERVSVVKKDQACTDAFLKCCVEAERLRQIQIQEDALKGLSRTASRADIEDFFMDTYNQYIRRHFPESFSFIEIDVKGTTSHRLPLPDSITTWEIQIVTLSPNSGFCVVEPAEVKVTKTTFVSLRLPISVKKYEQISLSPVIYNYGDEPLHVAVHLEQTHGLCTPGSATTTAFVNITVAPSSSQFVTFSAVPMVTGLVPIKIRLYDIENEMGLDAIEKHLNVKTEGLEMREEAIKLIKLDGKNSRTFKYNGTLPDGTVPDSSSSVFISMEGNGFGNAQANYLLSPEVVAKLIVLPTGCLEQTMAKLAPTTFALRYLDLSEQWFNLPAGKRDDTLDKIEQGYMNILTYKMNDQSYGLYGRTSPNNWVTALVVKVLSMVAERQVGAQGRATKVVPAVEIQKPVRYLRSVQKSDGTYTDAEMVLHRGVLKGSDQTASLTAFITIALHRSLPFLQREDRANVEASISKSKTYLLSQFDNLQHPYAVAITAYCLTFCTPEGIQGEDLWRKLQAMSMKVSDEYDCYLWSTDANAKNRKRGKAITVETTAYALLTAITLKKVKWATGAACWLSTQESYSGFFISTQDTIMALQALSEYELFKADSPQTNAVAEFTVLGKKDIISLELKDNKEKVETDLKKLTGNEINVQLTGTGEAKLKIVKAYYLLDSKDDCDKLSITVTVQGKVKYTAKIPIIYEYYEDYKDEEANARVSRSADEEYVAHARNKREADPEQSSEDITYTVCVRHSPTYILTGMGIADITLLSGFEAVIEDLDRLKDSSEAYISHYEVTYGRVLLYFDKLFQPEECISFSAVQRVPIGLLQPAPAVFYDYYEPSRKCTRFYSAPLRSKLVSKLCSEDVCQCAERPCHKKKLTFNRKVKALTKADRAEHACFYPTVDYAYMVEVVNVSTKSNFELYETKVTDVLRSHGDAPVTKNSVRVFAKRRHCKEDLDLGKEYLIMGKDGATTDSDGEMQYLLEANTWVELKPSDEKCGKTANQPLCKGFNDFVTEYKVDGCRQ
ncbi:complement C4-B isoform X2 [Betta splendens]|nr:complement C4-B isoform X2 [Betta splendens]